MAVGADDRTTTDNRRHEHGLLLLAFRFPTTLDAALYLRRQLQNSHGDSWPRRCWTSTRCRTLPAARSLLSGGSGSENCGLLHLLQRQRPAKAAIRDDNQFFEHVLLYNKENLPEEEYLLPWIKQGWCGKEKMLLFLLSDASPCAASGERWKSGFDPEVIDLISLKPLDLKQSVPQCVKLIE